MLVDEFWSLCLLMFDGCVLVMMLVGFCAC